MSINNNNRKTRRRMNAFTVLFAVASSIPPSALAAENGKTLRMPEVTVKASALPNDGAVDGYKAGTSRSSTRTETPLIDVPQSISVVTQDQIRDQGIQSMREAMQYVPGITVNQG